MARVLPSQPLEVLGRAPGRSTAQHVGQRRAVDVAVIGMGPWGLAVVERLMSVVRGQDPGSVRLRIHVIDAKQPGPGVYHPDLPWHLLMNTPCGQISLCPEDSQEMWNLPYMRSLCEWAQDQGYSWKDDLCDQGPGGRPVSKEDFLPRRVTGRYLQWFYEQLMSACPEGVAVTEHREEAVSTDPVPGGGERVTLRSGEVLEVDHVILTVGHTANQEPDDSGFSDPYAVVRSPGSVAADEVVAISGMGLVSTDVLTSLTRGLGGRFEAVGDRLVYRPSGREPKIYLLSRTGLPYCAKSLGMRNVTTTFKPEIWTTAKVAELRAESRRQGRGGVLSWERELFPLLLGEMSLQYYTQAESLRSGAEAGARLREQLAASWRRGELEGRVAELSPELGGFDARAHFYPDLSSGLDSRERFQDTVLELVERDLDEALKPAGSSPVKMAYEVLRFLRDPIRRAVEFGGLDEPSHRAFFPGVSSRIARLVAGPPALRAMQLVALVEAGVVEIPFGPAPRLEPDGRGGAVISSTLLRRPHSASVDRVVRGFMEGPVVHRSQSPLIRNLHRQGRLLPMDGREGPLVGLSMTREAHPVSDCRVEESRLWIFGAITEGSRYFTNCIPSPGSRRWSFEEALRCASQILQVRSSATREAEAVGR